MLNCDRSQFQKITYGMIPSYGIPEKKKNQRQKIIQCWPEVRGRKRM